MKIIFILLIMAVTINTVAQDESQPYPELANRMDSMNYFFGLTVGYSLKTAPFETNPAMISEALVLAMDGKSAYDEATARELFQQLLQSLSNETAGAASAGNDENMQAGLAFLAENKNKEGVVTSESGLQYKVVTKGDGPTPTATSTVEVHYEGTLIDGTVFDSSYDRGESISFPLNRVIKGWTEGVQLMTVGSTYNFYIPSELAYGSKGSGSIPSNSVLLFKIELLGIK